MPVVSRHADLLTPWQRFAARWLGWQYARIWVKCQGQGWFHLIVRVFPDKGGEVVRMIDWTRYEYSQLDGVGLGVGVTGPARLEHFQHFMLTERDES